jgi:hypothetical protein
MMSHLKNSNYKMAYEDARYPVKLDNAAVIYNTTSGELSKQEAKRLALGDKGAKLHLTQMPATTT